jgi:hypothetical protein
MGAAWGWEGPAAAGGGPTIVKEGDLVLLWGGRCTSLSHPSGSVPFSSPASFRLTARHTTPR